MAVKSTISEGEEENEVTEEKSGEIAFPNFKDFMNSDGPFQLSYPDANLQPTKFAINDEARNFPKEAIERLGEGQKAKEKADKTLKTISETIEVDEVQSQEVEAPSKSRRKRYIPGGSLFNRFLVGNSIGNTLPIGNAIGNRPIFDGLFFGGNSIFARRPRQIIRRPRPQRPALRPVYPPVDPFGNTEYIPLPGPSSPHYALPIHNNENPHFSKTKHRFVRPIRQSKYPKSNFFKYDSSKAFYKNKKEVLRQIQFNNLP